MLRRGGAPGLLRAAAPGKAGTSSGAAVAVTGAVMTASGGLAEAELEAEVEVSAEDSARTYAVLANPYLLQTIFQNLHVQVGCIGPYGEGILLAKERVMRLGTPPCAGPTSLMSQGCGTVVDYLAAVR